MERLTFKCYAGRPLPKAVQGQLRANIPIRCWLEPYRITICVKNWASPDRRRICACIDPEINEIIWLIAEADAEEDFKAAQERNAKSGNSGAKSPNDA